MDPVGMYKLIVSQQTHRILGAHVVNEQALEVVQIAARAWQPICGWSNWRIADRLQPCLNSRPGRSPDRPPAGVSPVTRMAGPG
jgi:hypothetical protein